MRKARGSESAATFLSQFDRRFHVQEYTCRPNVYISSSSLFTSHVIARVHVPRNINHIWIFSKTTPECTHHFFLTVRGELRGRSLRPRHLHLRRDRRSMSLFARRLRFQVALERLLVKGFRKRHLIRKCLCFILRVGKSSPLLRLMRSPWTDGIISTFGRKSTEKTTERKERRFRAVSVRTF